MFFTFLSVISIQKYFNKSWVININNLKMSNDSYTVPTLSLTNSRSRKNIPTKDAYQPRSYMSEAMNVPMTPISYLQKK